jgi:hypothetical protein
MDTDNLSLSIVSPSLTFTLPERRLASAAAPSSPRRLHADAAFETLCSSLRCGTPLQLLTSPRRVRALPSTPAHEAEEVLSTIPPLNYFSLLFCFVFNSSFLSRFPRFPCSVKSPFACNFAALFVL